jgi:tRNA A-37 threonylcarbamoyl transferase component Bud32/tetratricopeptide (TPR) repeat protein
MQPERWARLEQLFAEASTLPSEARAAFLQFGCGEDTELRSEIDGLLRWHDAPGALDTAPHASETRLPLPSLSLGDRLGPWRIERLIGRGGMGEVYLATRVDAAFEQRAALKLLRHEAVGEMARFHAERRILATLEHPGIARLLDGGMAADGRPYTVMEYVEGRTLTDYCREHRSSLNERLALFAQVCDAVAFAHRNLIVHRDLKPDNIVVNADGGVKLLDFGIAKLLDTAATDVTIAPFTPDYAAPEQRSGEAVTTATDIYALGVLLFELLTDERPLRTRGLPSAQALKMIFEREAPAPSRIAQTKLDAPVSARLLNGDLDAIVAKCLRKEPGRRYDTVNALVHDVQCHLRKEPVLAREGARLYVVGRLLRRYRWAVAAVAALILTLAAGLAGTAWQARRANVQAARATATKDFLLGVFRANDARVASEKARGQTTARELLDSASARIEVDFAGQPDLQIELLGLTATIYGNLSDEERYAAMQKRRIELARAHYGDAHPIVLEGLLSEADAACVRQDYAKANRLLDETDVLLRTSGQDHSSLRADWWRTKARALGAVANGQAERHRALQQALSLYAELAPHSNEYAAALNMEARDLSERGEHVQAKQFMEQAVAAAQSAPEPNEALIANLLHNVARKLENLGEFDAAERGFVRAAEQARKTFGEHHATYWITLAYHARLLHQRGERERAHAIFAHMLATIPADWKTNSSDSWARETYAECLTAEGRASEAIPLLEAAADAYLKRSTNEYDVREVQRKLGDAYDRAGRTDDARRILQSSRDEYIAKEPDSVWTLRIRERWARFLIDHAQAGDSGFAESEFQTVIKAAAGRPLLESALAHAGLARIASARGETALALTQSELALSTLERVEGLYDVRVGPQLWLVRSDALLRSGDAAGASQWAKKALEATRRYDDPTSATIAQAEAAVRLAAAASNKG